MMNNIQLVHSFSTKYNNDTRFFINVLCFTLSCIYAKRSGFKINLHTDNKGYEYLKYAPYDNIYTDLEDIEFKEKSLFAAPKFIVMEKYPLGTIHIDGDVFLKKESLKEILNFTNYDCIIQSVEEPPIYGYGWDFNATLLSCCNYPSWANRECNAMFNNGVLGFNNQELKNEYIDTYWHMYNQYASKVKNKSGVPDLVIEQQFLYDLCKYKEYKVKYVIDGNNPSKSANTIGYQHLLGSAKLKEYNKVLETIKKLDLEVYNNLKSAFSNTIKFCFV